MAPSVPQVSDLAAVVLAAGAGTRLRPLTRLRPKALCPVDNVPLVDLAVGWARNVTAAFELQGNAKQGRLDLSTPLGTTLARARWAPDRVALVTSQGETRFDNLDALTREVLGESLPVAALFDWLRGRPWPGAASTRTAPPAEPGFQQLGWVVSLARFDEGWIAARRNQAPVVTVRAKLDRP